MNEADQATLDRLKANRIALGLGNERMVGLGDGLNRLTPEELARHQEKLRQGVEEGHAKWVETLARYGDAFAKSARAQARYRASQPARDAEAIQRTAREAQARAERPANIRLIKWCVIGALVGAVIRYLLVGRLW